MSEPDDLRPVDSTHVLLRNRRLVFFAGCDYFRLSWHPDVTRALVAGLDEFGLSVAASRLTTGNHVVYRRVEQALAKFFGAQQATLVSAGYMADLVAAEALAGEFSHAVLDSAAHPALARAADLLGCPVMKFESRQAADLARTLRRCGEASKPIVLTDGMFSRDGAAAPLKEYLRVLPRGGKLLVDDAHGAGVLGKTGQGTLEYCGVSRSRVIQTITLSKAFGVYGGAVLGDARLHGTILDRSAMFVGSTPTPLPLMSAALKSLSILGGKNSMRASLLQNATRLKSGLRDHGFPVPDNPGPIVALAPSNPDVSRRVRASLLAAGIYPSLIHYPGIPQSGYYRFVISSEHTPAQIDCLLEALRSFSPEELLAP